MSTTTERKVTVASGLGDADASQVMAGSTFSSESGFKQEGKFIPSAGNITYNNATSKLGSTNTQGAIDEIVTLTNESGHSIDVTLNKSTYVMTISLKDKNGEVLNEKTVDFPMETAFVNASYDKASKTMKFTLESGSTVDVPLGDLVEGLVSQTDFNVLSGEVETLKTEVNNNTNAISEIEANITTNIYNLNDVVKGKWITGKNGSTGDSTSWAYLPLKVKGLKTVTISALGGTASWNKHYFNDSNGTTIAYNNSQVTASVPSDATILYVNIYEEFTDINAIKITTESVGEVVTDLSDLATGYYGNDITTKQANGYWNYDNGKLTNKITDTASYMKLCILYYDSSNTFISQLQTIISSVGKYNIEFTAPSNCKYIKFKHNGDSKDIPYNDALCEVVGGKKYTFIANFDGVDVTTTGGISFSLQIKEYIASNAQLTSDINGISDDLLNIKMLGWTVPEECPIQNTISGNTFTQKVGRVDLGSLHWSKDSPSGHERFNSVQLKRTIKFPTDKDNNGLFKGLCTKYTIDSANGTYLHAKDKTISVDVAGNIWIYDSSYNDKNADDFKNSLKGVYLYYELANHITMTIDGNEAIEVINNKTNKNLLPVEDFSIIKDGITFIGNSKTGEISVSGTCTSYMNTAVSKIIRLKAGKYVVSGSVGGSNSTYGIVIQYDGNTIWQTNDEVIIELTKTTDVNFLYAWVFYNVSVNNIIKPMVRVYGDTSEYEVGTYNNETLTDMVDNINSSMSDYGLNNVFDGEFEKGRFNKTTNVIEYNPNFLCCKNKISCNSGDKITLKTTKPFNRFFVHFFNSGTYVSTYDGVYTETASLIDATIDVPADVDSFIFEVTAHEVTTIVSYGHIGVYVNNQIDVVKNDVNVLKNDKEDKYTLELNYCTKCVIFENVVNTDEYFEAMVFDRSDKKKYIKVSGYRPSENAEENEISYINLGSKTLNIVGSNNQTIMFSGGSEVYDAYIKAIR